MYGEMRKAGDREGDTPPERGAESPLKKGAHAESCQRYSTSEISTPTYSTSDMRLKRQVMSYCPCIYHLKDLNELIMSARIVILIGG